eukprot:SAG31_NODE_2605_length_5397_cov_8.070970_4_plen_169_part_00
MRGFSPVNSALTFSPLANFGSVEPRHADESELERTNLAILDIRRPDQKKSDQNSTMFQGATCEELNGAEGNVIGAHQCSRGLVRVPKNSVSLARPGRSSLQSTWMPCLVYLTVWTRASAAICCQARATLSVTSKASSCLRHTQGNLQSSHTTLGVWCELAPPTNTIDL